jgi:CheY-like chemotaxis protein
MREAMPVKTILLVDDSRTLLMMEKTILRRGPYRLLTASDGEEAIAKAASERPDLILLDLVMPRLDGLQTCRRLKEDETTRGIPVIIVTTRGEVGKREEAFACGCDDFVTKPIDACSLIEKVESHLGGS